MLFFLGQKCLVDMLEVKSMEKFHLVLYKINMGCVCVCGAWPAWWLYDALYLMVGSMKALIYSLFFKLKGFSVHYISF